MFYLKFSDYTLPLCCRIERKEVIGVVFEVASIRRQLLWSNQSSQGVAGVRRGLREGVKWST